MLDEQKANVSVNEKWVAETYKSQEAKNMFIIIKAWISSSSYNL